MKKLMVALAAVATAFGLYADGPSYTFLSGSDFESGTLDTTYWKSSVEGAATVVEGSHGILETDIRRSAQYKGSDDAKLLKLATKLGNPVTNNVLSTGVAKEIPAENLCYDALVNFTVFDAGDDQIPAADFVDAKLAVYLQLASEADDAATNLYVYAKNGGTAQAFQCSTEVTPGWHRLTIKAIKDIGGTQPGFVVFIDGDAVKSEAAILEGDAAAALNVIAAEYNRLGKLFVSTSTAAEITSVCFDGQGSVDEAYFATGSVAAFTDDPATFALAVGADIESFTATYGTTIKTWTKGASPLAFVVDASVDPQVVSIEANCTEGKFLKKTEYAVDGKDITIDDAVVAVASVGDQKYDDLADAIAAAAAAKEPVVLLTTFTEAIEVTDNVTLDLNGKQIDDLSTADNVEIVLTNSAETDAIVSGDATMAEGAINVTNIKFDYNSNIAPPPNEGCGLQLEPTGAVADYEFVQGEGADSIYWVLKLKPTEVETPTAVTGLTYNGNEQTGVANDAEKYESISGNTATAAGSYEAVITLKSGYVWKDESFDGKVKWSIAQADTTIKTAPTASAEIEKGAALSTIYLVGGEGSVAGAFDWTAPDTKVDADGEYEVTFTPTDATNYKTATCMVSVKVKADVPVPQDLPGTEKDDYIDWATTGKGATIPAGDEALTADKDLIDAYLLDCENGVNALKDAREAFKFTSIEFKDGKWVTKIDDTYVDLAGYGNGVIKIGRYSDVECKTASETGNFFKAKLDFKTAND